MTGRVKNSLFFNIKDSPFSQAEKLIKESNLAALNTLYKPTEQTTVFFAAARESGQDEEALALCRMLLERSIPVDHADELNQSALFYAARQGHAGTIQYLMRQGANPNLVDKNGETAIFYAVSKKQVDAVKALLDGGANLEVVNKWKHTCMSVAPTELLPTLVEERKKRRRYDSGPGPKRRRTALEELRSWANEWPVTEQVVGERMNYKDEDVILQSDGYAVVKNAPETCAARIRVLEKNFVVDHARLLEGEPWFQDLTPEDLCETVEVISDLGNSVNAIKHVLCGKNPRHFTLPLVETKTQMIVGYVHASYKPEKQQMAIAHMKVDTDHTGRGLGGLLINAAEDYSTYIGWSCITTCLSVLTANARAQRCYSKAGFKFESSSTALWGSKQHPGFEWECWRKVHKHFGKKSKNFEKQ
eukprot:Skav201548  [mRNA]  locus=scaffold1616:243567:244817:+ [translate_table: standard]